MNNQDPPGDETPGNDDVPVSDRLEAAAGYRARLENLPELDVTIEVPPDLVETARELHTILQQHGQDPKPFDEFLEDVALDQVSFELVLPSPA